MEPDTKEKGRRLWTGDPARSHQARDSMFPEGSDREKTLSTERGANATVQKRPNLPNPKIPS